MSRALSGDVTVRDEARAAHISYAAAHAAADRLVSRGLLFRERAAQRQLLRPTAAARALACSQPELPRLGSNQDSSDPESDVLPVTPRGNFTEQNDIDLCAKSQVVNHLLTSTISRRHARPSGVRA